MRASEFIIERKKRSKKTRGLGGYFFPGYGFYGGDSGEGGGDGGGGGESKQGMSEAIAADQVLDYVKRTTAPEEFDIEYSITDHPEWELKTIPLSQLNLDPDGETQDPYNRVNWVDYDKVQELIPRIGLVLKSKPIVVDSAGWIIDGNHRAMAAVEAGMTSVPALVPANQKVAEGGAESSWSNDTGKITLQDILELTKHIKQINLPINDNLKSKLLHWDGNPEEMERVNQVTVSNQFPILIMVDEQGQIAWILDGNHRLHKAIQSQAKTIPAKLIRPSDLNDKAKKIFRIKEQGVAEGTEQKPVVIYTNHRGATIDDDIKKSLRTTQEPFNKLQMWEKHKSMKDPKIADWVTNKLLPELKQNGVLKPLLVWNNNGQLFVIDGNHRFLAYQEAGYRGRVPVQIVPDNMIIVSDTVPGQQGMAENFADGKNPGRKGLSKRVGIPKKATLGKLEKIAQSSTGERRRMAQWQLNMRRGKKK